MRRFFTILYVGLMCVAAAALAAVQPDAVTVQGILTDAEGVPLLGQFEVIARLMDAEIGGQMVHEEPFSPLTVSENGRYVLTLGANPDDPLTVDLSQRLWLELEVDSETLSPRLPVLPAPYSISAGDLSIEPGKSARWWTDAGHVDGEWRMETNEEGELQVIRNDQPYLAFQPGETLNRVSLYGNQLRFQDGGYSWLVYKADGDLNFRCASDSSRWCRFGSTHNGKAHVWLEETGHLRCGGMTTDDAYVQLYHDGEYAFIQVENGGELVINTADNVVRPAGNGQESLGRSDKRWAAVYTAQVDAEAVKLPGGILTCDEDGRLLYDGAPLWSDDDEIATLRRENAALKERVQALETRMQALERMISEDALN